MKSTHQFLAFALLFSLVITGCQKETIRGSFENERYISGHRAIFALDFNSDGTVVFSSSLDEVETQRGSYEIDGNEITVYMDGWSDTFMRQGDVLVDTSEGRWVRR